MSKLSAARRLLGARRELAPLLSSWLFQLEFRDRTFWGSLVEEDEEAVTALVRAAGSHPGPIIEIGVLFGFTTQLIATFKPTRKPLIAVENFSWNPFGLSPTDHRVITRRVLRYCLTHCSTTLFDGAARDFYASYVGAPPAMVFIDAGHSFEAVKTDIAWAVGQGVGIISGHDYNEAHVEVMAAVDHSFGAGITVRGSVWSHHAGA